MAHFFTREARLSAQSSQAAYTANTHQNQSTQKTTKHFEELDLTPFLKKVAFFSSGGAFLDGYVLSIIGVALVQLTVTLQLTTSWTAIIGASALAGIFVGTILGGYLTDIIGRRRMFIIDVIAIAILSVLCMFLSDALQLTILRFLIGFFVGADYPIATSLIAEFTPKDHRAKTTSMVSGAWYVGATAAAVVGFLLINVDGGWRWMLGSAFIPSIVLLFGRRGIPESPMWLARRGRTDEARSIVKQVFGAGVMYDYEAPTEIHFSKIFKKGYLSRIIFMGIFILCQVVPMYAIYTFGPDILAAFGFTSDSLSVLGEAVISLLFFIGVLPAMRWLNTFGRRTTALFSLALMAVGLLILGIFPNAPIAIVVFAFALYAFFSGGPGTLQWLYPNEIFPTEIRASAVGVAIGFSRIGTVISTYLLPIALVEFGIGTTMLVGAGLVILGLVVTYFMAPETSGLTLQQTSALDPSITEKKKKREQTSADVTDTGTTHANR